MSNEQTRNPQGNASVLKVAYRPGEVAKALGIGITRTSQYISEGRIKSVGTGKCILVTEEAIRAFLSDAAATGGV